MSVLSTTVIPGFGSHFAYSRDEGWTVVEVWDHEVDVRAFFEANVKSALPPGVVPTVVALHNVMTP